MCHICQILGTMQWEVFVKVEELAESCSSLGSGRQSGRSVTFSSFVHVSGLAGPLWRLDRLIPAPPQLRRPPLYACQTPPPHHPTFPWEGFHCLSSLLHCFQIRCLECYTDQGKIINWPFVLATCSTVENKLMVMQPYRACLRRWVWCDVPCSGVELSSRNPLLGARAHSQLSKLQLFLLLPLPTAPAD